MKSLATLGPYALATLFQLPFHLLLASPFLACAWVTWYLTRRTPHTLIRHLLLCGIGALGLAPAYGFHLSMVPIYTLITWVVLLAIVVPVLAIKSRVVARVPN